LEHVPGKIVVLTNSKLQYILEKNPGFNTLMLIIDILFNKTTKNNSEIEYNTKFQKN